MLTTSHGRCFLDCIATHILVAEGDSQWTFFNGNYEEYVEDKKKRFGEESANLGFLSGSVKMQWFVSEPMTVSPSQ